jgi:hypothetical protein
MISAKRLALPITLGLRQKGYSSLKMDKPWVLAFSELTSRRFSPPLKKYPITYYFGTNKEKLEEERIKMENEKLRMEYQKLIMELK